MERFTLSCTNDDCPWEVDREYEDSREAEEAADCECCARCGSDLVVL